MSSLRNKILFHYQTGTGTTPVANPVTIQLNDEIDNPQAVYLHGYTFIGNANPAPAFYWISCDQVSIPITIHTNGPHNHRFPLHLDNAKDGNSVAISKWYHNPMPIAIVRNTTKRLKSFTLTFQNPDDSLVSWTSMALWLSVSTPLGDFPMKKTMPRTISDPPYFDKQLGQEDVESILYR